MADVATQPAKPEGFNMRAMAEVIATAVADAVAKANAAVRPVEHFRSSKVSAYNPTGGVRPKLTRNIVFCSAEEREEKLTNEEIELYNQIKPGRYNKRKWEVIERASDNPSDPSLLEIRIPVSDINARMELPGEGLKAILRQMIAEHDKAQAEKKSA
jgi:hypothetical protein